MQRVIVETKDEHDFDPKGRDFAKRLRLDLETIGTAHWTPAGKKAQFSMLRHEHYARAQAIFGTDDFDRVFVVHAPSITALSDLKPALAAHRIHWLTIREVVADLATWYGDGKNRAALRHTLMGDLWHLLVGYCGLRLPES